MHVETHVAGKLPAWHALSELFLDTDLQERDYRSIAARLDAAGFTRDELRAILKDEVAPAFAPNLWQVAGEWAGWSEERVADIVTRSNARPRLVRWLKARAASRMYEKEWNKLVALLSV